MASLEAERAAQRFKQGIKTASVALIYAITVTSQVKNSLCFNRLQQLTKLSLYIGRSPRRSIFSLLMDL